MTSALRLALVIAVLAVAACTSSSPDDEEGADRARRGAETDTGRASASPSAPERTTETEWLARYALWVTDLRVALEDAGVARHVRGRPVDAESLPADVEAERSTALAELQECARRVEELGAPPPGLLRSARLLLRACQGFAWGAENEAAGAPYWRAFSAWSRGAALVRRANAALPTRQQTERLPLPVGGGLTGQSRIEPVLSDVANRIAAPAAQVRCWAPREWRQVKREIFGGNPDIAGFASHDSKRVGLPDDICRRLALLTYRGAQPGGLGQLQVAVAVAVLMHESGHLNETGDFYGAGQNEPLAECWAMQHIRQGARALGARRAYAGELARRYWREIYPTRPRGYRTPRCRDGGRYDERPASSVWP